MALLCKCLLSDLHSSEVKSIKKLFASKTVLEVFDGRQVLDQVETLAKCLLHLMGQETDIDDVEATHQHVAYFTEYKGKALFERAWRTALYKEESWWKAQADEVLQTSAKAVLIAPEVSHLRSLLGQEITSHDLLEECLQLYKKVEGSIRKIHHQELAKKLCEQLMSMAQDFLDGKSKVPLSSRSVDSVIEGLATFKMIPGSMSLSEALIKWMSKEARSIARMDMDMFLKHNSSDQVSPEHIDFEAFRPILDKAMKFQVVMDGENRDIAVACLVKMVKGLMHKVGLDLKRGQTVSSMVRHIANLFLIL